MRVPEKSVLTGVAVLSAVAMAVLSLHRSDREAVRESGGPPLRIAEIQGSSHVSPVVGQRVEDVSGIVTAVLDDGFFMQDPREDGRPETSEALFVFTAGEARVRAGDRVVVSGRVVEHYPGGKDSGDLPITELAWVDVRVLSSGHALPPPITLTLSAAGPGERVLPCDVIEDDAGGRSVDVPYHRFDPDEDALDFFESLEGMRVRILEAVVVGPLNRFGELVVVVSDEAAEKQRTARGGLLLAPGNSNPERLIIDDRILAGPPVANVGDVLVRCIGIVDYSFGSFRVLNTEPLRLVRCPDDPVSRRRRTLTVASYNVFNLDPGDKSRIRRIAGQISRPLKCPDILALQEMQDQNGSLNDDVVAGERTFQALVDAIFDEGGPRYSFRQIDPIDDQDGGEPGGNVRVGYLFRPERVDFLDPLVAPVFEGLPEIRGRPFQEAGRIQAAPFVGSRKALLAAFRFRRETVVMINVHQRSRYGDAPLFGRVQPAPDPTQRVREEQAKVLGSLVRRMLAAQPRAPIVVLGDFNDTEFGSSLELLAGPLTNLTERLPPQERYTYIYRGNSQALDHILVTKSLAGRAEYEVVHLNAEFADAASDHDPVLARFTFP